MHSQRKEIGSLSAYRVLDAREIRELNSEGFVLEHKKTGARLFLMSTDDENRCSRGLPHTARETAPGVPHILSTASSAVQKNSR